MNKSCAKKSRNELGIEITGKDDPDNKDKYWVFELGTPQKLAKPITKPTTEHFQLKLTKADQVENGVDWNSLVEVYDFSYT